MKKRIAIALSLLAMPIIAKQSFREMVFFASLEEYSKDKTEANKNFILDTLRGIKGIPIKKDGTTKANMTKLADFLGMTPDKLEQERKAPAEILKQASDKMQGIIKNAKDSNTMARKGLKAIEDNLKAVATAGDVSIEISMVGQGEGGLKSDLK